VNQIDISTDGIDRRIIAALHATPRATNKLVATVVGISEATVASRIRRLVASGALAFTVQRDIRRQGYRSYALYYIDTAGHARSAVAASLARLDVFKTVVTFQDSPEILAVTYTADSLDTWAVVTEQLANIEGVFSVAVEISLSVFKHSTNYAMIINP
jgi:DNA-binding Lrp family transcriptional regulator